MRMFSPVYFFFLHWEWGTRWFGGGSFWCPHRMVQNSWLWDSGDNVHYFTRERRVSWVFFLLFILTYLVLWIYKAKRQTIDTWIWYMLWSLLFVYVWRLGAFFIANLFCLCTIFMVESWKIDVFIYKNSIWAGANNPGRYNLPKKKEKTSVWNILSMLTFFEKWNTFLSEYGQTYCK